MKRYGNCLALTAAIALGLALFPGLEKTSAASDRDKPGLFVDSQWLQQIKSHQPLATRLQDTVTVGDTTGAAAAPGVTPPASQAELDADEEAGIDSTC